MMIGDDMGKEIAVPEPAEEHQGGADKSADSEAQQEEQINDPLTRTATRAPKVSWQPDPEEP